jgi:ribosome-associated toxin RatA of RatAB toxin-antitoxin module
MPDVEKSIEVNVPVHTAYNQWTQFEEFPRFMEGVKEVRQLDDKRLHWRAEIAGREKEWDAEITDQTPDQRIAWSSTDGAANGGAALFEPIGADQTRITLRIDYNPDDFVETVGGVLGFVGRRVQGDLDRFKEFMEARGEETGAWRGEIHGNEVDTDGSGTSAGYSSPSRGMERESSGMGGTAAGAYGETATGSHASSNFTHEAEMERRATGAGTTSGFDERDMAREHGRELTDEDDAERDHFQEEHRTDRAA